MKTKAKLTVLCFLAMLATASAQTPGLNQPPAISPDAIPAPRGGAAQPTAPQSDDQTPYGRSLDAESRPHSLRRMSWIYIDNPPLRKVRVHDIITVIVDEKSEVTQDSRFNRQRNAILKAQLREWIRIDDMFRLKPAAQDSPTIDTQLRSQLNSFGVANSREGMKYRIAATVVDVLPNGTLILEARKTIQTNEDVWEYSLTGRIRSEDVLANNTVLSENVADLAIAKKEFGKIQDSTKRGHFLRLYDTLLPF